MFDSPRIFPLEADQGGYFRTLVDSAQAGDWYEFLLDDEERGYPDPASRFQPQGPHGPSQIVDPRSFVWTDAAWPGLQLEGAVFYEMHIGTFTSEGTWQAAEQHFETLAELGVTAIEVMPVADFPGEFGWGYDGVNWFAPTRLYGEPDDFRRFVDRAHAAGLGVVLDVVYNHFGPDGNYLAAFSDDYFSDRHPTPWGSAINYDGPRSAAVREFVIANASYWVAEYHIDGLRFDSTQDIHDDSSLHVLAETTSAARRAAGKRSLIIVAENHPQDIRHVHAPSANGFGMDAIWNDDFHHAAFVALTGNRRSYCTDYRGTPQELLSAIKWGFLFQGQHSRYSARRRGTAALQLPPAHTVAFLENHDQVSNTGVGLRRHQMGSPGVYRALTAVLLLAPSTPLLFQGQEFAATAPFAYFAAHQGELAQLVAKGRKSFMGSFPNLATEAMQARIPIPNAAETFQQCKLDWSEFKRNEHAVELHRDLLRLRRTDPVIRAQSGELDGALLGEEAFVIRFFGDGCADRLLLINLGYDLELPVIAEPLLAEPAGHRWEVIWSSEDPRYGGQGSAPVQQGGSWHVAGQAAVLCAAIPGEPLAEDRHG